MKSFKQILNESWRKKRLKNQLKNVSKYNRLSTEDQFTIDGANKRLMRIANSAPDNAIDDLGRKILYKSAFRAAREAGDVLNPLNKKDIIKYYDKFVDRENAMAMVASLDKKRKNKQRRLQNILNRIKK